MEEAYRVGQTIEARYQAKKFGASGTKWFRGKIASIEQKNGKTVYSVEYGERYASFAELVLWPP